MVRIATFKNANVESDSSFSHDGLPDMAAKRGIECADEFDDLWLAMN
jgi:hypothetical protein